MAPGPLPKLRFSSAEELCAVLAPGEQAGAVMAPRQGAADFLAALVAEGLLPDAIRYLAVALPRREAVWWACATRRRMPAAETEPEQAAWGAAETWVYEPTEPNRQATYAHAEGLKFDTAGAYAALGAFWSGGSLAPPEIGQHVRRGRAHRHRRRRRGDVPLRAGRGAHHRGAPPAGARHRPRHRPRRQRAHGRRAVIPTLRLTVTEPDSIPAQDRVRAVTGTALRIGREADNDWILTDPARRMSRHHCTIDFQGGVYVVIDTSANGVFHNDATRPLGRGSSRILSDGDVLRFPGVTLAVALIEDSAARDAFRAVLPPRRGAPAAAASADPLDDLLAQPAASWGADPLDDTALPEAPDAGLPFGAGPFPSLSLATSAIDGSACPGRRSAGPTRRSPRPRGRASASATAASPSIRRSPRRCPVRR